MRIEIKNMNFDNIRDKIRKFRVIIIIAVLVISIVVLANIFISQEKQKKSDQFQAKLNVIIGDKQTLDCNRCHTAKQSPFVAGDTINRSSSCYKCHREDIDFLVPVSSQVHIYHEGNMSILPGYLAGTDGTDYIDYSARHKDVLGSCDTCHIYAKDKPPACIRCHSGNHVEDKIGTGKIGTDKVEDSKSSICGDCHGSINDLFRHDTIRLETHNIFGNQSCRMCHSPDKISLELANGNRASVTKSSNLCKQCHFRIYKEWTNGDHISGVECTICHNPHSPKNMNQTIIDIAKEIVAEKKVDKTPPKSKNEEEAQRILIKNYNYDKV